MADVKWIKITTGIFDDEKILLIESMPSADSIIVIWFKLLTLAGKQNNDGVFMMSNRIPYTDEMLASIFRRDVNTVRMALKVFEQFGMIEIVNNVITIPNWNKHQSLDAYEKKKERDRLYQAERRAAQRALIAKSSDTSSDASPDTSFDVAVSDKEEDKERELEGDSKRKSVPAGKPPSPPALQKPKQPDVIDFGSLSPNVVSAVERWLQYKKERRESYKPTGLQALITQIENNVAKYGEDAVIELIGACMAANWRGIIFDKLKNQSQPQRQPQQQKSGGDRILEMLRDGAFDE